MIKVQQNSYTPIGKCMTLDELTDLMDNYYALRSAKEADFEIVLVDLGEERLNDVDFKLYDKRYPDPRDAEKMMAGKEYGKKLLYEIRQSRDIHQVVNKYKTMIKEDDLLQIEFKQI